MPEDPNSKPHTSTLPAGVQALHEMEMNQYQQQAAATNGPNISSTKDTPGPETNHPDFWTKLRMSRIGELWKKGLAMKILIGAAALMALFVILMLILTLTAADTQIFKLTLAGQVTDEAGNAVAGASIDLGDNLTATSDNNGNFAIGNLEVKRYTIVISQDRYQTFTQEIAMSRSFLNYTNNRTFVLKASGQSSITGKLITTDKNYNFVDDYILVGTNKFAVKQDGTFEIADQKSGKTTLTFVSSNYKDEVRTVDLQSGKNVVPDITLTPAGDIVGTAVSWIHEKPLLDLQITAEGVLPEQVTIGEDAKFRIRDLEVAKTYKVRVEKSGYLTRDYQIGVKQGENELFGFKVVENGLIPFVRKVDSGTELFVSEFDGTNAKQLTNVDASPVNEYISGDTVYFQSDDERIPSSIGGRVLMIYSVKAKGGSVQTVVTNDFDLGRIVPDYAHQIAANVYTGKTKSSQALEVMKLDGTNRTQIYEVADGEINDVLISGNGKTISWEVEDNAGKTTGLYISTITNPKPQRISTKPSIFGRAISDDGTRILYSATNSDTKLADLYLYNTTNLQDSTLRNAYTGNDYQFVNGKNDQLLFHDNRDGGDNLYLFNLLDNTQKKITSFSGSVEGITRVYQRSGLVVYQTNKGMYVLDIAEPKLGKLVTNNFYNYAQ